MLRFLPLILFGAGTVLAVFGLTGPALACMSAGLFIQSI